MIRYIGKSLSERSLTVKINKKYFKIVWGAAAILYCLCLSSCASSNVEPALAAVSASPMVTSTPTPTPIPTPTPEPTEPPFEEYDITLMALGDNLMHMGIVYTGQQADGSYDYSFLFENITDFIDASDIRIINQETIMAGNQLGFSGFPRFNSPTEVGDAIAAAGFNVVLHASNHTADKGLDGIKSCTAFWEKYPEILMVGMSGDTLKESVSDGDSEESRIPILTIGDITFAVLNYTYGPNMETLPKTLMGHLNMLCNYDLDSGRIDFTTLNPQVIQDISEAKELADIVIVCPHWGTEYVTKPSRYQQAFAKEMADAGADLIIGTHPHVPQPVEWIVTEDGHKTLCYYSLGNYASTQKQVICMLEEMAWVTFHVTEDDVFIDEDSCGALPLVCHYRSGPVRFTGVYLLEDYTEDQAKSHGIWDYGGVALYLEDLQKYSEDILGDMALTRSDILGTDSAVSQE